MELICAAVMVLFRRYILYFLAMLQIIQSNASSHVASMALVPNAKLVKMLFKTWSVQMREHRNGQPQS
jgi:uncharacterized protein YsxB (DUF464 family)